MLRDIRCGRENTDATDDNARVALTPAERYVVDEVERRRDALVELASELIGFDTTAVALDEPPGEEAALQRHLAGRLQRAGAVIDLWEPDPDAVRGSRQVPGEFHFRGRPQLAARLAGTGGGRALLLNGHVDVVPPGERAHWTSDPFEPELRGGALYGRGACDMKGGVACMVLAAEVLAGLEQGLRGDLTVCTVTDEEATGAGGIAAVARGVRADAGLVPEPTGFDVWVACRGDVIPTVTVPGRLGHAGVEQPHFDAGGAVNAIDKAALVMAGLSELQEEWRARTDHQHPYLSAGHILPTVIRGGDWVVNFPASCSVTYHVAYLPGHADSEGWGTRVERELSDRIERIAATDPWLAQHPPEIQWSVDIPPAEVSVDEPIVAAALEAGADVGRPGAPAGLDSWHDGATFTRFAGTPTVAFGPPSLATAHAVDEHVRVDDLVSCCQALALAALRFCG